MTNMTELRDAMPLTAKLGIEIVEATAARVSGRLAWAADLCTAGGILHAGRSVIVVQTNVYDPDRRRVAHVTQSQAVLEARAYGPGPGAGRDHSGTRLVGTRLGRLSPDRAAGTSGR
jgi:acyl-coenzyme A thioesterase PaaI-like protein